MLVANERGEMVRSFQLYVKGKEPGGVVYPPVDGERALRSMQRHLYTWLIRTYDYSGKIAWN